MQHSKLNTPLIAVTAGEPAGIGPDLCVGLARRRVPARIVVIADRELLEQRARRLRTSLKVVDFPPDEDAAVRAGALLVRHVPLARRDEDMSKERQRVSARMALHARKSDEAYLEWLRQLRDRAYIEQRLDER